MIIMITVKAGSIGGVGQANAHREIDFLVTRLLHDPLALGVFQVWLGHTQDDQDPETGL